MNKQELKEQVSSLPSKLIFKKVMVNKDSVLELIDQLDEPKPKSRKILIGRGSGLSLLGRWSDG